MEGLFFGILGFLIFALIWLIPLVLLINSNRTVGGVKVLWVFAFLFVSWFAWVVYILFVPRAKPTRRFTHMQ